MPEQPDDPIHYDMKIPPEPQHADKSDDSAKESDHPAPPSDTAPSDTAKDTRAVRGHDRPQAVRHSE
ncbi:MAG TPA: hypothetical protein VGG85_01190 [Terracidiphilus sp.]|jgi:hypothetical protein